MKIIEKGSGQNWHLRIKCEVVRDKLGLSYDHTKEHCGSLLEIDKHDVMIRHWEKFDEDGDDYVVKCPVCGCCLYLDPGLVPEWVGSQAKEWG